MALRLARSRNMAEHLDHCSVNSHFAEKMNWDRHATYTIAKMKYGLRCWKRSGMVRDNWSSRWTSDGAILGDSKLTGTSRREKRTKDLLMLRPEWRETNTSSDNGVRCYLSCLLPPTWLMTHKTCDHASYWLGLERRRRDYPVWVPYCTVSESVSSSQLTPPFPTHYCVVYDAEWRDPLGMRDMGVGTSRSRSAVLHKR